MGRFFPLACLAILFIHQPAFADVPFVETTHGATITQAENGKFRIEVSTEKRFTDGRAIQRSTKLPLPSLDTTQRAAIASLWARAAGLGEVYDTLQAVQVWPVDETVRIAAVFSRRYNEEDTLPITVTVPAEMLLPAQVTGVRAVLTALPGKANAVRAAGKAAEG